MPRIVQIKKVDMFGFCGRERHPDKRHEGLRGLVLASFYEGEDCWRQDAAISPELGRAILQGDDDLLVYEVLEVYIHETNEVLTFIDFEVEECGQLGRTE